VAAVQESQPRLLPGFFTRHRVADGSGAKRALIQTRHDEDQAGKVRDCGVLNKDNAASSAASRRGQLLVGGMRVVKDGSRPTIASCDHQRRAVPAARCGYPRTPPSPRRRPDGTK